jgi:hypothetical protein
MRKLEMTSARFRGEDGNHLSVSRFDNSNSLQIHLEVDGRQGCFLFLEGDEPLRLRDLLVSLYPTTRRGDRRIGDHAVRFNTPDGEVLSFSHSNRGEPYREGVHVSLEFADYEYWGHLFLEEDEVRRLRDLLNTLYPAEG